jgi:hypothetical protein
MTVMDGIESHPFHPEIEDDWFLVHQATDPKHPSLTSFFTKRGQEKAYEQFIGFLLQSTFLELPCLAHTAGMRCSLSHGALCYT